MVGINENHAGKGDGTVARPYLEGAIDAKSSLTRKID